MPGPVEAISPRLWRLLAVLAAVALGVYVVDATSDVVIPFLRRVLDVLSPFVVAFAFAYTLDPVVDWMQAKGRSRTFGVTVVTVLSLAIVVGFLLLVIPAAVDEVSDLVPGV